MIDSDFAAYIEGLPAQDRRTVEQALVGLRSALKRPLSAGAETDADVQGRNRIGELLTALRDIARRDHKTRAWLGAAMTKH